MAPAMERLGMVNDSAPRWNFDFVPLLSRLHCFLQGIPKKMKELEFAHVMMVGTAANMAVYVLRDTEEEDQVLCSWKYRQEFNLWNFQEEMEEFEILDQADMEYTA